MTDNLTRRSFMMKGLTTVGAAHILAQITATEMALAQEVEAVSPSGGGAGGFQNLKAQYLLDPRVSYLNHASIGTVPRSVHTAGIRYREICEENPWLYIWGGEWEEPREGVRRRAAELLGCVPDLVAITHNTTEGFNVLARGLPLSRGDEVLFSTLNHAGASVCWEHFGAERGYSVRVFDFPVEETPGLTAEDVVRLHQEEIGPNTRVLVLPHIDNIVGLRHPLRELADMAKDNGVEYVLVDGAQSAGMIPVKLSESGVDAYATSPHKWIQSAKGLGLFYVSRDLVGELPPSWVTWGQAQWQGTARIFEDYGTRDLPEVLSLGAALDFQAALGEGRKETEYRRMFADLKEKVEGTSGLQWRSPRRWEMGAMLMAVGLEKRRADEVSSTLYGEHGIVIRPFPADGLNSLRVSPNLMNTQQELERLLNILEEMER